MTNLFYLTWPFMIFLIIWYIGISFFERNARPFISSYLRWKSFNTLLLIVLIWITYIFVNRHTRIFGNNLPASVDIHNNIQFLHLASMLLIISLVVVLWIVRMISYRKKIKNEELLKNISISAAVIILLPLTIWFVVIYIESPKYTNDFLMIIADIISVGVALVFTFIKRLRVASSVVNSTVYSIALMVIWLNKFAIEYASNSALSHNWETSVTLISLTIVVLLIFIKNNPATKIQSLSELLFVFNVMVFILIEWVISGWSDARQSLNTTFSLFGVSSDETLNTLVLFSLLGLVATSIIAWYKVQSRINYNLSKKLKSVKGGRNG